MELKDIAIRIASRTEVVLHHKPRFGSSPFDLISVALRIAGMESVSYVKKEKGKGYCVKSEHNPDWSGGCYPSKEEANKRLEQVEAAKHAKAAAPQKPIKRVPESKSPYKSDEEARKHLKPAEPPKRPSSNPPGPSKPVERDSSEPEYADVDTFAQYLYDNEMGEFDHIDLKNLNETTKTPIREIQADLEGYGFTRKERPIDKKVRGISDNPHGTPPFAGMSGGAAYQSVLDKKYGRNPFEEA